MVGNKARVEGCIAEEFKFKEIAYFTSLYFAEEHNVNVPTMRYHIDQEDPSSDLKIFQWKGTTVGPGKVHHITSDDRNSALLYMYSNMDEMDNYFT